MLDQVITIFDGMQGMMKKLKKASYEKNMKEFLRRNDHFFREMTDYLDEHENKKEAAEEVASIFVNSVRQEFMTKGKIKGTLQADLNFFMIYYVFPAILLTRHDEAGVLADAICEAWGNTFKNSKIGYTDYDKLYNSFREKILGIF